MRLARLLKTLSTLCAALLFAPALMAQTSLSVSAEGWNSVWVQRGSSGLWDAVWTRGGDQVSTVMEGSIRGAQVTMRRISSSDGALCEYRGTIGGDGRSVSGTQACPGFATQSWVGQLQGGRAPILPNLGNLLGGGASGPLTVSVEGWTSTWRQRGSSGTWDAVWERGNERIVTVMQGSVQRDQVNLRRTSSSDGALCEYRGVVAADRRSVSGTQSCPGHPDVAWAGYFGDGGFVGGGVGGGGPAPVAGARYRVENLLFNQNERGGNPHSRREFMVDAARCSVRELNSSTDQGRQQVQVTLCQPNRRIAFATMINGQVTAEYDWVFRDDGRDAVGTWRDGNSFGPSIGSR